MKQENLILIKLNFVFSAANAFTFFHLFDNVRSSLELPDDTADK